MLYLVGLGLCDASDITVKGLEVVKKSSKVYLEAYTSILTVGKEELVNHRYYTHVAQVDRTQLCILFSNYMHALFKPHMYILLYYAFTDDSDHRYLCITYLFRRSIMGVR